MFPNMRKIMCPIKEEEPEYICTVKFYLLAAFF